MSNYISLISGTLPDASFDGTDLSDKKFYCYDFVKGILPIQKESIIDVPKMPGITQSSKKFIARPLKLYGYMDCVSHSDLITKINNLASFLYSDDDQQLIWSEESDRYYNTQYMDYLEVWRKKDYALVLLMFNCNDPFAYAVTADDEDETGITVKGHTWNITNSGHYYAYPTITITFNQIQSHIYISNNTLSACRFDISKGFEVADVLTLNSKTMVINLNDIYSPAGFGDGGEGKLEYILLDYKAVNELEIGTDDATLDVDVNVTFRKTYF